MISLKQLHYALSVEQTRHFRKAAEICSVSQSALSTAVLELETQLGVQLFERDNKKVLVTPVGQQILARVRGFDLQAWPRLGTSYRSHLPTESLQSPDLSYYPPTANMSSLR